MILELLKFGIIFFLPTIIGRSIKLYQDLKKKNFALISWKTQSGFNKLIAGITVIYVISKLSSVFVFGPENFFIKVNARIDSPSYIIRNHYREYLESWANKNELVREFVTSKENELETTKFEGMPLYKKFLDMELLSEKLKIKEKKNVYCKYGERAFLNCDYCVNDNDFIMYLAPLVIFEYSLFLIIAGALSANSYKSNWRTYGLITAFLIFLVESYAFVFPSHSPTKFEAYDAIFGDDLFTLRSEKIFFIRDLVFALFLIIVLLFDNGKDLRLKTGLENLRCSIETSLSFLQAARIQEAALACDETLHKFASESKRKISSRFSLITGDPGFRQKVAESGHKLNMEELIEQKGKNIDELLKLSKKH